MTDYITDLTRITDAMAITGPIENYIWDELTDGCYWDSIEDIASQLESASCSAGSWSDMISTHDIDAKLNDSDWREAIDEALSDYSDCTGKSPNFDPYGVGFELSQTVTFAVDWAAFALASRLRNLGRVAVVSASVASMDPSPDVIAFDTDYEARDWAEGEISRRVQHRIEHSPYAISDLEIEGMIEQESALFNVREEVL
jgi:hypothetical protein